MNDNAAPELAPKPGDSYVQSFARGLSVIRAFDATAPRQTLTEVSRRCGLTRAGARRILLTLETLGYVKSDGRLFALTPKILDLGFAYLSSQPLWQFAEPVMQQLAAELNESVSAAVLEGQDIVYVLRVPARKIMSINLGVGSRLPAWCTSMGRILLASLPPPALEAQLGQLNIAPLASRTVANLPDLRERIAQTGRQGWCLVNQELEDGLVSLAAPITDRKGQVIAALNVGSQVNRRSPEQLLEQTLPRLLDAAGQISRLLQIKA
ncbi:IclR family transcriptional regulator C-terminal domain-containing protein [Paucibacter sp. DJ2R-2]|uniref:IclR family transcriptional regulator domain-containing protein n=1 Tax=Paucibacter sp. DJ2R-2 TaxID=2893558 RepID=UPI0021E3EF41|nr:IclR family transcriptional regulator C-terminal domain-containing protein [Paucibacter sp. DJ2R-2]MCV2421529.1 helix-turn-helix domain-containing protein [Paucibacter sp. DJ4R-1]MCV2438234.1 helix-turn-helix domain-containing protein [Paucibacter sp. DJ2R-2]